MLYRTRTYIAADWDHDHDVVNKILEWNNAPECRLNFTYAHDLMQARDSSLNCSIKHSLHERMNGSDTFVLIASQETLKMTKGGCQFCGSYNSYTSSCARGYVIDYRSYIKYECELAARSHENDDIRIIIIYKDTSSHWDWIPHDLWGTGVEVTAYYRDSYGNLCWNKRMIINALMQ